MKPGERIKELRTKIKPKLTQEDLGEKIGESGKTISGIESGRSDLSSEQLIKISNFFKVTTDYILTGKESTNEISEEEREVLTAMREDTAFKEVAVEAAKLKKKVISYLKSYQIQQNRKARV